MNSEQNIQTISILGAGWLGLPLGQRLTELGFEVLGSTTSPEKVAAIREAGLTPFVIHVSEQVEGDDLKTFFSSDLLIVNIPPGRRQPEVETQHPKEIRAVYELAVSGGVRKMLFISSTGVYGNLNRVVTEADPPFPTRSSGKALATIEKMLRAQTALEVTILRLAGLVGGDRKAGRFLSGKKEVSNGQAPVNLVHRDDCIGVIRAVIRQGKWGEIYNVCADEHPTRQAFYTAQAQKEGLEPPTFREGDKPSFKIISNEKVKEELNYSFKYPDPEEF